LKRHDPYGFLKRHDPYGFLIYPTLGPLAQSAVIYFSLGQVPHGFLKRYDPYGFLKRHDPYGFLKRHDPYGFLKRHDPYGFLKRHDPTLGPLAQSAVIYFFHCGRKTLIYRLYFATALWAKRPKVGSCLFKNP
jgi:hypothetical protein